MVTCLQLQHSFFEHLFNLYCSGAFCFALHDYLYAKFEQHALHIFVSRSLDSHLFKETEVRPQKIRKQWTMKVFQVTTCKLLDRQGCILRIIHYFLLVVTMELRIFRFETRKQKNCTNKDSCKQCRYVKFQGIMTKWPVQKLCVFVRAILSLCP